MLSKEELPDNFSGNDSADMAVPPEEKVKGLECPACGDPNFCFKGIESKIVKSLLSQLEINHECDPRDECSILTFGYEELKTHVLNDCKIFKYRCKCCADAAEEQAAQDDLF